MNPQVLILCGNKRRTSFPKKHILDTNFEVKIPLACKPIQWNVFLCLAPLRSKIQRKHNNTHNPDSLCIFYLYMVFLNVYFIIVIPLLYDCLYSVSLKTLFYFFIFLPILCTLIWHCDPFKGLIHLNLSLLHICNSLLPERLLKMPSAS